MENYEIQGDSTSQVTNANQSQSTSCGSKKKDTVQKFTNDINNYLDTVSSAVDKSSNSKLKNEHQRLTDLLASYKRLVNRLHKDNEQTLNKDKIITSLTTGRKPKEINPVLSEIYAVLQPDLYKNSGEENKKDRITKFAKKRLYTHSQKVLPPNTVPPSYIVKDRRQDEKDRFCKSVSSAPSWFHNNLASLPSTSKSLRKSCFAEFPVENVCEKEKDRLAKIFSKSPLTNLKSSRRSTPPGIGSKIALSTNIVRNKETQGKLACNQENINPQTGITSQKMVKVGEYSPLNGNLRGKTTLGVGEQSGHSKQVISEGRREYKKMPKQIYKNHEMTDDIRNEEINHKYPTPRTNSASTQTDSEDSMILCHDNEQEFDSPMQSLTSSPCRRGRMEFSPREKLISDLYGSPPISNHQQARDEKEKQAAYAEALRAQIEEKKRLEEHRKLLEKQEEELIEKRVREQAEKVHMEYLMEQNKKFDWMQQRKEQEEILRRRLHELELESKEFKKQERQKRFQRNSEVDQWSSTLSRRTMDTRHASPSFQNPGNALGPSRYELPKLRDTFTKSPILDIAPLLDSDGQNVLSDMASELNFGNNEIKEQLETLTLGPGVNLLSPQYIPSPRGRRRLEREKFYTKSAGNEEKPMGAMDRYDLPVGLMSPRSVNHQEICIPKIAEPSDHPEDEILETVGHEANILRNNRPPSPVVPALQTDMLLKRNSRVLDEKIKACRLSNDLSIVEPLNKSDINQNCSILTQLGEFRRKLAMEHQLLEQRLKESNS